MKGEHGDKSTLRLQTCSEEESLLLGEAIGRMLEPGDVLALIGELGAGKTLLTRGIAAGLDIQDGTPVTSPTFTLINEYDGRLRLYHLDLYRIGDPEEIETLPWREVLFGSGVAVIEWPERLGRYLPEDRWEIEIEAIGDTYRKISIRAVGDRNLFRLPLWVRSVAEPRPDV